MEFVDGSSNRWVVTSPYGRNHEVAILLNGKEQSDVRRLQVDIDPNNSSHNGFVQILVERFAGAERIVLRKPTVEIE